MQMRDEFRPRRESPWPLGLPVSIDGRPTRDALDPRGVILVDRPETELVALMEAPPHSAAAESVEANAELKELLGRVIYETLGDPRDSRESWVFHAHTFDDLSIRAIAKQIGLHKSQVGRILQSAKLKLAEALEKEPIIRERLNGPQ